ncbi:MAG: c-type cytochrome [Polyangiales bacterium]
MATPEPGRPSTLDIMPLRIAFAILSVALFGVLAIAPATSYFSDWRAVQQRYNALARRAGREPIDVHIRQTSPAADVADRCGTCHLGAAGVASVDGDPLFAVHPPIPHDPARFGCTTCHGGQGRALTARAAHGGQPSWEVPLLAPRHREAGCGLCHSHVRAPDPARVAAGEALFRARGCGGCHGVDGREVEGLRDLSRVGLRGVPREWHQQHLRAASKSTDARWAACSLPMEDSERAAVDAYLMSLIGAPKLMAGKALAMRLGCRGCHRIAGVGGDGPDLSDIGNRRLSDLDFSQVRGGRTLADWLREVLMDPSRLDPHSRMPTPALEPAEVDELITYLLSLKTRDIPVTQWPPDRVRGMLLGERDFAVDGRSLFLAFCSACHGSRGEGNRPGGRAVVVAPAVGSAEFLAIASDAFLRRTLREGRPAHRMPPWGASDGGLRPEEITSIVAYLRTLQPAPATFAEVDSVDPDLAHGRGVFQSVCTPCHGDHGEGTAIGPPLAATDSPVRTHKNAIYGTLVTGVEDTAMGSFRSFDTRTLRDVISAVQELEPTSATRKDWQPRHGNVDRGRDLFAQHCVTCHGAQPDERHAPAIQDPRFLSMTLDSFLTASIVRRHDRRLERFRRSPEEVSDLVTYLRSLSAADRKAE